MLERSEEALPQAPMFPLPDTILFAGQVLPLHIFESRYRSMTHDLLDGKGELIIGTVLGDDQKQLVQVAPVQRVGGLGRLESYEKLSDGRYVVAVVGIGRVTLNPIESNKPYPMAEYQMLPEDDFIEDELQTRVKLLLAEKPEFDEVASEMSVTQMVDVLIMTADIPIEDKYAFYALESLNERAIHAVNASSS